MMNRSFLPVDVIYLSDAAGNIRPLRIRAEAGFDRAMVAQVTEILRHGESGVFGAETHTFLCRVRSGGNTSILELKYFVRSHRWVLAPGNCQ